MSKIVILNGIETEIPEFDPMTHRYDTRIGAVRPYTEEELKRPNTTRKIEEAKQRLADMDYKGQKYLDGEYSEEEWQAITTERKEIRAQIRGFEAQLQEN